MTQQVVQGLEDSERNTEALSFFNAVAQGMADIREGNTFTLEEVRKILDVE